MTTYYIVERPGGGVALNAGHPEVLLDGAGPKRFPTPDAAHSFMAAHNYEPHEYAVIEGTE